MEIKRDYYLNQLISGQGNHLIKIITGMRRCGKSYLLFKLFYNYLKAQGVEEQCIIKIAFDDWDYRHLCDPDKLMEYIKAHVQDNKTYYLLFDEVQLLNEFVPVLNGLLRKDNLDIYVTGSNSKFLSSDIITEFRGRGDQIHIYPLSFAEYMSAVDVPVNVAWKDYYTFGGLPMLLSLDTDKKKAEYLSNLYWTVYFSDILDRHKIKNKGEFNELVLVLASSLGSLCNPLKLSNTFKSQKNITISNKTISGYLSYLEDAFIVEKSIRYNIKGKRYINTLSKYYFSDIGVRNAILDFRQQEETHIMENIIYNELRVRGFNVDVGVVEAREMNKTGQVVRKQLEVDFVANQGNMRYYIQSVLTMPVLEKEQQESASLIKIDDSFKKIIIVKDDIKPKRNERGIVTIGLFDFLLNPDSLNW